MCYVGLHPSVKGVSGRYLSNNNMYEASDKSRDAELAKKLWDFSVKLTTRFSDIWWCCSEIVDGGRGML